MNGQGTYHVLLRVSALTLALVLLFDSGLLSPLTKQLSHNTQDYLANAIGVQARVQPTELNQYTAQLTQYEQELNQREAAIEEREISVGLTTGVERQSNSDLSTYILSVILFILLVLIILNYVLDFVRDRRTFLATSTHEPQT